jgi:hypothetical protein
MLFGKFMARRLASRRHAPHVVGNGDDRTPAPILDAVGAPMPEFEALDWGALAFAVRAAASS